MNKEKENRYIELTRSNIALILKVCSMYARNREDFRDLHQDIHLQIWKSLDSFRGDSKISTWLYRIALNCAILNHRKSGRTIKTTEDSVFEKHMPAESEPVFGQEDFNILHSAIRVLPEIDRAIIMLYLEEQPYNEISKITGLTVIAISVRILRIKKKLKMILEQQGYNIG